MNTGLLRGTSRRRRPLIYVPFAANQRLDLIYNAVTGSGVDTPVLTSPAIGPYKDSRKDGSGNIFITYEVLAGGQMVAGRQLQPGAPIRGLMIKAWAKASVANNGLLIVYPYDYDLTAINNGVINLYGFASASNWTSGSAFVPTGGIGNTQFKYAVNPGGSQVITYILAALGYFVDAP